MNKIILSLLAGTLAISFSSCVSSKKFKSLEAEQASLRGKNTDLENALTLCNQEKMNIQGQVRNLEGDKASLQQQISILKESNTQALNQLENVSVISKQQAESIKRSMENLGMKDSYIQTLQQQMAYKDSLNMALVMNLKGAIGNLDDQDINIKVDKGVVYIDISDKLLFKSGSYDITDKASTVLGKVATVLKNQPDLEFMVEGHTDNVPFKGSGMMLDNWDLSVKRATSVVRVLQNQYGLDPKKMSAAGRGEYNPVVANDSPEGKAANRRTRIVVLPQLDQFFKLLETPKKP